MATFLLSSVKSCEGGHGLCHHLLEMGVWPSSPKKERVMTLVIFFHTSVESCVGDHGISSREEGVWPSSSKTERSMTMAISLLLRWSWHIFQRRRGRLFLSLRRRRMTVATCLSSSLDSLQHQDPPLTCKLRRRREKLGQGGHGLGHHLLGWSCSSSPQ